MKPNFRTYFFGVVILNISWKNNMGQFFSDV